MDPTDPNRPGRYNVFQTTPQQSEQHHQEPYVQETSPLHSRSFTMPTPLASPIYSPGLPSNYGSSHRGSPLYGSTPYQSQPYESPPYTPTTLAAFPTAHTSYSPLNGYGGPQPPLESHYGTPQPTPSAPAAMVLENRFRSPTLMPEPVHGWNQSPRPPSGHYQRSFTLSTVPMLDTDLSYGMQQHRHQQQPASPDLGPYIGSTAPSISYYPTAPSMQHTASEAGRTGGRSSYNAHDTLRQDIHPEERRNLNQTRQTHVSPPLTSSNSYSGHYPGRISRLWAHNEANASFAAEPESYREDDHDSTSFPEWGRKALLIGINYRGQANWLDGCINDVESIGPFIMFEGGYGLENLKILSDNKKPGHEDYPTKKKIINSIKWLVEGAKSGHRLFFHFSGHGTQVPDEDGDETDDHMDEAIVPVDHKKNGFIVDDELNRVLVRPLPKGCRLTAIIDACHSGSALDLQYRYEYEAGGSTLRLIPEERRQDRSSEADVVLLSGCKDTQESTDTKWDYRDVGAMSKIFFESLNAKKDQTYQELMFDIGIRMKKGGYKQTPQISSSKELDVNSLFIF